MDEQMIKLEKRVRTLFSSCLTCRGSKVWPFQFAKDKMCKIIRCKRCQKELNKIWFENYHDYIAVFRGQV